MDKIPVELERVQVDIFCFSLDNLEEKLEQVQVNLEFGLKKIYMLWTWINLKIS
jgi:hypothetical protein